jgi:hypothetical protein
VPVTVSAGDDAQWVRAAARNNAELCELVSRGHGAAGAFAVDAWTCARRTPALYPDAVTLDPDVDIDRLLARIDASAGASVKDSFAVLDLTPASFRIRFSAEWIVHPARVSGGAPSSSSSSFAWSRVDDAIGLRAWEAAWGEGAGTFRPTLLDQLCVLRGERDGVLVAGAILNRSESVVGVSNFFVSTGDPVAAWSSLLDEIAVRFAELAIVGYESGETLEVALRSGFRSIGPLRVWTKE